MWNKFSKLAPSFLLPLFFLFLSVAISAPADILTFIPQNGNYDYFSSDNWFTNDAVTQALGHVGHIPSPPDTAVIDYGVNAAANTIHLDTLVINPNATVSGGDFIVSKLVMHGGYGGGTTSFNGSSIDVLSEMDVQGGSCGLNSSILTIDFGAICFIGAGGTGQLGFSGSTIYNAGQIALFPNSNSILSGGTNLVNLPGAIISGGSNTVLSVSGGNFDNSGTVRSDGGMLQVSAFTWSSSGGLGKFKAALTNSIMRFPSGLSVPTNATYIFSGPGTTQIQGAGTVQGTAQIGVYDTNLLGWDEGTLQLTATLSGTGVVHVAAAPGFPSELDCGSSSILNGPVINVDSGGNLIFDAPGGSGCQITGGAVNNSGTAVWKSNTLTLVSPGIFNNLAGGLFDCQIMNNSVDGNILGNGTVNNAGTFRKSKGTNAIIFASYGPGFNNSGLLDVASGKVQLSSGTNSGTFSMTPGAEIWFAGNTNTFVAGAQIAGTNFVRVNQSAVLLLRTNLTVANFQLNSGTLDGPADLIVSNTFNWTDGTVQGGGAINIPAGGTFNLITGSMMQRTINNAGTTISTNGFVGAYLGATFNNLAGALLEIRNNGGFGFPNPPATPRPVLNNFGTIRNLSPTTAPLAFNITNQGLVQIQSNRLNCYQYHQLFRKPPRWLPTPC